MTLDARTHAKLIERLKKLRGARSQRKWGRELGATQQNINRWEGGTMPDVDAFVTIARVENVTLDWLIMGRGRKRP